MGRVMDLHDPIPIQKTVLKSPVPHTGCSPLALTPATRANYDVLATTTAARVQSVCKERFCSTRGIEKKQLDTRHSADRDVREICADDLR